MKEARKAKDREAHKAAADKLHALMENRPKLTTTLDKIRDVLNDEQKAKFDKIVAKMKERHDKRREDRKKRFGKGRKGGKNSENEGAGET